MELTDNQIKQAIERKESIFLSNRELEDIWTNASTKKNIEMLTLKNSFHSGYLDAMYIKAFKIDSRKAQIIADIKDYLLETIHIQKINNMQAEIIDSLNLKLFEMEFRNRELNETIDRLNEGI